MPQRLPVCVDEVSRKWVCSFLRSHPRQQHLTKLKSKLAATEAKEVDLLALDRRLRKHAAKLEQVTKALQCIGKWED